MAAARHCPICRRPVTAALESLPAWFPFCSERCRQIDLLRWTQGKYAIVEPLTPERMLELDAEASSGDDPPYPAS